MSEYYPITKQEMDAFMSRNGFQPVTVNIQGTQVRELVYAKRVKQGDLELSLRVFTGINPSGESRGVGEDAIRVSLAMRTWEPNQQTGVNEPVIREIGGSKKVLRVKGWEKNLQNRIDNWLQFMPQEVCDQCGAPMLPRQNRKTGNKFLGCARYPHCNNTRSLPAAPQS